MRPPYISEIVAWLRPGHGDPLHSRSALLARLAGVTKSRQNALWRDIDHNLARELHALDVDRGGAERVVLEVICEVIKAMPSGASQVTIEVARFINSPDKMISALAAETIASIAMSSNRKRRAELALASLRQVARRFANRPHARINACMAMGAAGDRASTCVPTLLNLCGDPEVAEVVAAALNAIPAPQRSRGETQLTKHDQRVISKATFREVDLRSILSSFATEMTDEEDEDDEDEATNSGDDEEWGGDTEEEEREITHNPYTGEPLKPGDHLDLADMDLQEDEQFCPYCGRSNRNHYDFMSRWMDCAEFQTVCS